jgi:hypothetical protein
MALSSIFAWLQNADGGARRVFLVPRKDTLEPIGSEGTPRQEVVRHCALRLTYAFTHVESSITVASTVSQKRCEQSNHIWCL